MAATEIKRYFIHEHAWDEFMTVWRRIVTVRRRHGFGVLFAYKDGEQNLFTWAIEHTGDFDAAARSYYRDPERVELEIVADYVSSWEVRRVEPVALPQ